MWSLVALALAGAWSGRRLVAARPPSALGSVALILYGESDPGRIMAAGLHGLGGRPTRVGLSQDAPCRFTLATGTQSETVDFRRVASIRYAEMVDPAAGLIGLAAGPGRAAASTPRLTVAVLDGTEDAVCAPSGCVGRRVFALSRPERVGEARAASETMSRRCPHQP